MALTKVRSAGFTAGAVLQIVQVHKVDSFSSTASSATDITGLTVSITPQSTSNKVFVTLSMYISYQDSLMVRLLRDSTEIGSGTSGSAHNGFAFIRQSESGFIEHAGIQYLDSPSSTSSLTYKIQGWEVGGQSSPDDVWTVNRRVSSAHYGASSQLTVMEIAG